MSKKLMEEFNNLPNDYSKWRWVIAHQDEGITVFLDNDSTHVSFLGYEDWDCGCFDEYIGSSWGLSSLLEVVGIRAEPV